jgi:tetratricopeptide (TPR) repeat protein
LALGWTLREAVEEYRELTRGVAGVARLDQDQLRVWETHTRRQPRASTIDLLCRLYRTNAQMLGLAGDYQAATGGEEDVASAAGTGNALGGTARLPAPASEQAPGSDSGLDRLDRVRRGIDRTLALATVNPAQLDLLDERVLWLRHQYTTTAPTSMLAALLAELEEVHVLSAERQPAAVQTRLSEITAVLATLIADSLMKLGQLRHSRTWYATARTAADDSGNSELRARVRAQAAMLPYYYGPLEAAATSAHEARLLSSRRQPTATSALAAAAEARALARLGDAAAADHAIHSARADFERCRPGNAEDAFAFPERRFLLYLSGALTHLGRSREAQQVQQQALALYADHTGIDPALLRLEQAICLARDRNLTEACQLATACYYQLPEQHRTPIVGARARHVIEVLPRRMRSAKAARELGDVLALPAAM